MTERTKLQANTDFLTLLRDETLHLLMLMASPDGMVVTNEAGKASANDSQRCCTSETIQTFSKLKTICGQTTHNSTLSLSNSGTSQLTGLLNRAGAISAAEDNRLNDEGRSPMCVAVMDLEHFKRVNDSYGHLVGDEVLAKLASVLQQATRQPDIIGRFGGEEFVALLLNTDLEAGASFGERIRSSIEEASVEIEDELQILGTQPVERLSRRRMGPETGWNQGRTPPDDGAMSADCEDRGKRLSALETIAPRNGRRRATRVLMLAIWVLVVAFAATALVADPTILTSAVLGAFVFLFCAVHAQWILSHWARSRGWKRFSARMDGTGYISELYGLPNRNYLLAEIRREISASRTQHSTFTMLQFSFDTLDGIRQRRGQEFSERATAAMVKLLRRITRDSDFISYIGDAQFVVLLNECTGPQSMTYLKRVPGTIAVSNGKRMFEVPVTARMSEYDTESIYATDVLSEVETAPPLARKEAMHSSALAA